MKVYLIIEIEDDGMPYRRKDEAREKLMNRDQRDTWDTIYQAYKSAQRALAMAQEEQLRPIREREAQAAEALLEGTTAPRVRSITRKVG
jgi:hypothetical protein